MRAPTRAAIYAAEMRVVEARSNVRENWDRARIALRAKVPRPAMAALIAGAVGVVVWGLKRSHQRPVAASAAVARGAKSRSVLRRMAVFIVQYQLQGLPFVLKEVGAAWSQRAAHPDIDSAPATDYSAAGVLH